ncbi:MAG: hypothetical protein HC902_05595 [Calothrix sp. SM1_5_4]|nr:hypothetical protein [Calothrix sp. SM1_5_4]
MRIPVPGEREWSHPSFEIAKRIRSMMYMANDARRKLVFIKAQMAFEIANEPGLRTDGGLLLNATLSKVAPSNGGTDNGSSFIDLNTDLPNSFTSQPRRLNSGNGNRSERLDYDTPELD